MVLCMNKDLDDKSRKLQLEHLYRDQGRLLLFCQLWSLLCQRVDPLFCIHNVLETLSAGTSGMVLYKAHGQTLFKST